MCAGGRTRTSPGSQQDSSLPWDLPVPPREIHHALRSPPSSQLTIIFPKMWTSRLSEVFENKLRESWTCMAHHRPCRATGTHWDPHIVPLAKHHPKRPHQNAPSLGCLSFSGATSAGTAAPFSPPYEYDFAFTSIKLAIFASSKNLISNDFILAPTQLITIIYSIRPTVQSIPAERLQEYTWKTSSPWGAIAEIRVCS